MFKMNRWFALVYLLWILFFGFYDVIHSSWWALFQFGFLPLAVYMVYESWGGYFGKKQSTN